MKKITIEKVVIGLVALLIGLLIGVYGTFSYIEKHVESVEEGIKTVETPDSFDGEYIVKYGYKELLSTMYHSIPTIGVIKVKKGVVSYSVNYSGLVRSGKSTYEIKDDSTVLFNGTSIGVIKENTRIKGDFIIELNSSFKRCGLILEKKL